MTTETVEESAPAVQNPLLEGYDPPVRYGDLGRRLSSSPLSNQNWRSVLPADREHFLDNPSEHYVPVRTSYDPAMGLQTLLRRALALLNPLRPENQVRVNRVALCQTPEDLMQASRADGAGGLWDGITGTGRSQLAIRVLHLLVPSQVIDYGPSEACGWARLRQIVWVYVDHPSNGTRMGLLKRVLMALDAAAGTNYFHENRRVVNLDTLLVEVCAKLAMHRVAILVIDENHEENLADSPWQHEFVMFYQSVMNLGLSILLIGNPLAFTNLMAYGQPVRRLMVGGIHHFRPASSASEPSWSGDFVPRMRKFCVVEESTVPKDLRDRLEFEFTAGLQGLYPLLNVQSQRLALRRAGQTAILTEDDLRKAAESPFYAEAKRIADCIRNVKAAEALHFRDIPDTAVAANAGDSSNVVPRLPNLDAVSFQAVKKLVTKFKQQQSRQATKFVQKLEVFAALTAEERKMLGISDELEAAAAQLKAQQEAAKEAAAAQKATEAAKRAATAAAKKEASETAKAERIKARAAKAAKAAEVSSK